MRTARLFYAMHHRKDPARRTREDWGNFGDELNPILLERLLNLRAEWAPAARCDLLAIGSVLDKFCFYRPTHALHRQRWIPRQRIVWGSGFMMEDSRLRRGAWNIAATRGPLSRERVPAQRGEIAMGDPGLLVARMMEKRPAKTAALGLVAHYVDQGDERLRDFIDAAPHRRLINVMAHPDDVLEQIAGCDAILSSSLHGLIAADALGVPNGWLTLSGKVRGGDFKFRDYWAGIGKPAMQPVTLADAGRALPDPADARTVDRACTGLLAAATGVGLS